MLKDSCHAVMNQAIIEGIKQRKMCEEREIADLLLWTIKPRSAACVVDVGPGMVEAKAFSPWTKYSILIRGKKGACHDPLLMLEGALDILGLSH